MWPFKRKKKEVKGYLTLILNTGYETIPNVRCLISKYKQNIEDMERIKISYILVDNQLSNLYINTGFYVHRIANEMKEKGYRSVKVEEIIVDISRDQLLEFLEQHKVSELTQ